MTINRNNYEEYFLLYTDRELDAGDQRMVEDFASRHPDLAKELQALRQTISAPPDLPYENREGLFRKEKTRRLFPAYGLRIAAALLVLLAGGWYLLLMKVNTRTPGNIPGSAKETVLQQDKKTAVKPPADARENPDALQKPRPDGRVQSDAGNQEKSIAHAAGKPDVRLRGKSNIRIAAKTNAGEKSFSATAENPLPEETIHSRDGKTADLQQKPETEGRTQSADPAKKADQKLDPEKTHQANTIEMAGPESFSTPLPSIAQNKTKSQSAQPSTINRQPSTETDATSILVFNNNDKAVPGFFKKLTARSSEDATPDQHRRKLRVGLFQFNLKKQ
jgi:hypothetical protein